MSRAAPSAESAERAVLGALLLTGRVHDAVLAGNLQPEDFGSPANRAIYEASLSIEDRGATIDVVTLSDELTARGTFRSIGGYSAISGLGSAVPSVSNLPDYVRQVRSSALRRALIELAQKIEQSAHDAEEVPTSVLEMATAAIDSLAHGSDGQADTLRHISELVGVVQADIEERERTGAVTSGFSTGLKEVDSIIGGLRRKEYIVIAARPSMGKSALLLNILDSVCVAEGKRALIFSLEMSGEANAARLLSGRARVPGLRIRDAQLRMDDRAPLEHAAGELARSGIWIDDDPKPSGAQIAARTRRFVNRHGKPDVIAVDYLQLAEGVGDAEHERIASVSKRINALKKEWDCAVVAVAQLNRDCEKRTDKRPIMSDLGGSGQIERDADVILFPFRPWVYTRSADDDGKAEIIVSKCRNGSVGTADVAWRGEMTRFENLDRGGWKQR